MSYLALARKWRPRRFAELVGQEHVVRALGNALESGRLHHAFLFTGTRGVGKTTIARIFAKSLNCERGVTSDPCGECGTCLEVDGGRFVDLIEIDAASNTGVDNVRDLIEKAQYAPTRGRTKVYLIDEVHMLSKPAFNALLKTLEEPPAHVKFLLATTDPDKLPVTVLSRCLQFNLKRLSEEQIAGQMRRILEAEDIAFEEGAMAPLAEGADGSLRDGLSLLDQAIVHGGGRVEEAPVREMLGSIDRERVARLLCALERSDGAGLMAEVESLSELSPDFAAVLAGLAEALHRIQLAQLVPVQASAAPLPETLAALVSSLAPEEVQLWYQMAIAGRRDLPLAPTPRMGFEMALLRMLAFRPASPAALPVSGNAPRAAPLAKRSEAMGSDARRFEAKEKVSATLANSPRAAAQREVREDRAGTIAHPELSEANWCALIESCQLAGPTRVFAAHTLFLDSQGAQIRVALRPEDAHLRSARAETAFERALAEHLVRPELRLLVEIADASGETLAERELRMNDVRHRDAAQAAATDPVVAALAGRLGARVVPQSIKPLD